MTKCPRRTTSVTASSWKSWQPSAESLRSLRKKKQQHHLQRLSCSSCKNFSSMDNRQKIWQGKMWVGKFALCIIIMLCRWSRQESHQVSRTYWQENLTPKIAVWCDFCFVWLLLIHWCTLFGKLICLLNQQVLGQNLRGKNKQWLLVVQLRLQLWKVR